jgi:hypothetical protein
MSSETGSEDGRAAYKGDEAVHDPEIKLYIVIHTLKHTVTGLLA